MNSEICRWQDHVKGWLTRGFELMLEWTPVGKWILLDQEIGGKLRLEQIGGLIGNGN